jgi:hydrogenase expression/formation protein HypE
VRAVKKGSLPMGKLDVHILRRLLRQYAIADERVLLGPGVGEDAAAIDLGHKVLIVATDPITFAADEIGYYSVMVNANDVASTGAEPRWYTVTILLPEKDATEGLVDEIFGQIYRACQTLDISIIGGHTEITHGLDRPILVGQMMGEVQKEALITTAGAEPGDLVLLSKGICIEGTSVIAREMEARLSSLGVSRDLVERAQGFLFDPGIGVVQEARLACQTGGVHAMHDPTEGGLANGLHELAMAAGVAVEVEIDRIPVYEESQVLCEAFELNPLGVIASGALLISASPPDAEEILDRADGQGVTMSRIGRVTGRGKPSVTMITPEGAAPLPYFDRDETLRIL